MQFQSLSSVCQQLGYFAVKKVQVKIFNSVTWCWVQKFLLFASTIMSAAVDHSSYVDIENI